VWEEEEENDDGMDKRWKRNTEGRREMIIAHQLWLVM
jgi:hypothetical protein